MGSNGESRLLRASGAPFVSRFGLRFFLILSGTSLSVHTNGETLAILAGAVDRVRPHPLMQMIDTNLPFGTRVDWNGAFPPSSAFCSGSGVLVCLFHFRQRRIPTAAKKPRNMPTKPTTSTTVILNVGPACSSACSSLVEASDDGAKPSFIELLSGTVMLCEIHESGATKSGKAPSLT